MPVVSMRGFGKVSDCVSLDGLVAPVVLARTNIQTAPGGLAHSSVASVPGDRPEHGMTSVKLVRFSPGGSNPLLTAAR